jgi:hypothetical protein
MLNPPSAIVTRNESQTLPTRSKAAGASSQHLSYPGCPSPPESAGGSARGCYWCAAASARMPVSWASGSSVPRSEAPAVSGRYRVATRPMAQAAIM